MNQFSEELDNGYIEKIKQFQNYINERHSINGQEEISLKDIGDVEPYKINLPQLLPQRKNKSTGHVVTFFSDVPQAIKKRNKGSI